VRSVRNEDIKYILTPCGNFNKLDDNNNNNNNCNNIYNNNNNNNVVIIIIIYIWSAKRYSGPQLIRYGKPLRCTLVSTLRQPTIDILYTLDSASNYSAIQKLKPWLHTHSKYIFKLFKWWKLLLFFKRILASGRLQHGRHLFKWGQPLEYSWLQFY
jgi:hypothetical protein